MSDEKVRVLWCDRYSGLLAETLYVHSYLDIVQAHSVSEAQKILSEDSSFRLIICSNVFDVDDGLTLFNSLNINGVSPQFLLFTSTKSARIQSYSILSNFTYMDKIDYSTEKFEVIIQELIYKTFSVVDINEKLKLVRILSGLMAGEFAHAMKVNISDVVNYELGKEIPSSFVVAVCEKFMIPLNWFCYYPLEKFEKNIRSYQSRIITRANG